MPKTRAALTERQRRFVERFLVHGNATRAAKEAGYASPHVQGSTLAKLSVVQAAIKAGQSKATGRNVMSRREGLEHLTKLAKRAPMPKDKIAATALIAKLKGWEAPRRLEHTGAGGKPIALTAVPATREQAVDALRLAKARDAALAADLKKLGDEP